MQLSDCMTVNLLPAWMREERDDVALASAIDDVAREAAGKSKHLTMWDQIDSMTERQLDELAWALDITWWDSMASIDSKRSMVKESDLVHRTLGTMGAAEGVATSYLGESKVVEWPEYDGHPHHFKLETGDLGLLTENRDRVLDRIAQAKRLSSKLDGIIIDFSSHMQLNTGLVVQSATREVHMFGIRSIWVYAGIGMSITERLTIDMSGM